MAPDELFNKNRRTSDRVRYAVRLNVRSLENGVVGASVDSEGETEIITRDGGLLVTTAVLKTGDQVQVSFRGKVIDAKVVGQVGIRGECYRYGIQFLRPAEDFWGITIPKTTGIIEAGRAVLECAVCGRREVLALGEIDLVVLEHTKTIAHDCTSCSRETLWKEPTPLSDESFAYGNEAYLIQQAEEKYRRRDVNDRKHSRVTVKMLACIQREGFADDKVDVLDVSRGGVRFFSFVDYQPGTRVTIAVPFMPHGANVFVPGRVIRVRCRPTVDIPGEFGLQYTDHP